ncbi:LOW QUALITY PROTEIN: hypothetical protein V1477_021146 [Vespula maculifrons]|uniref:Uncharacterized protein n=1 Tax=Vespula maculifrons TaxID=7453 RepID=A0ABD2AHA0_VESMC
MNKNFNIDFASRIVRHLMYQIVKSAEEADAAHEFITNLPNDMKLKLVRETLNYAVYGNNLLLLLGFLLQFIGRTMSYRFLFKYPPCLCVISYCVRYMIENTQEEEKEGETSLLDDEVWKDQCGAVL